MRQRHSIDILFSLPLSTVFVVCAFLVLLFQTGSYQAIIKQGKEVKRMYTPLAYLRAKIRSADEDRTVFVKQLEDMDAIVIHNKKERIVTYIYKCKGKLRGLHASGEVKPMLSAGTSLLTVHGSEARENGDLLQASTRNKQGEAGHMIMELKSGQRESAARKSHTNKPIPFLMGFIFVFFLFTLANAVCILVLGAAKNRNNLATDTRNTLRCGENLATQRKIPQVWQAVQKKIFYLDENRNRLSSQAGYCRVEIEQRKTVEGSGWALCELCIYRNDKELVRLPFLLGGNAQEQDLRNAACKLAQEHPVSS